MCLVTKFMAALVMAPAVLPQAPATALPCDNTRWCAPNIRVRARPIFGYCWRRHKLRLLHH